MDDHEAMAAALEEAALALDHGDVPVGAVGSLYNLCADPRLNHEVAVSHGVRAEEAAALLEQFFAARRRSAADGGAAG